jgi:hypothetical protein
MKPSPAQRRARAGPGPKKSCWARARVRPKNRAMGWPMGLVLNGHLYMEPRVGAQCAMSLGHAFAGRRRRDTRGHDDDAPPSQHTAATASPCSSSSLIPRNVSIGRLRLHQTCSVCVCDEKNTKLQPSTFSRFRSRAMNTVAYASDSLDRGTCMQTGRVNVLPLNNAGQR